MFPLEQEAYLVILHLEDITEARAGEGTVFELRWVCPIPEALLFTL